MVDKKEKIKEFIVQHLYTLSGEEVDIADSDNIFKLGIVNSMFAMQLIRFVEKEFDIVFLEDELKVSNFCSIENMLKLLSTKS